MQRNVVAQPSCVELRVLEQPDHGVLLVLDGLWGVEAACVVLANTDFQELILLDVLELVSGSDDLPCASSVVVAAVVRDDRTASDSSPPSRCNRTSHFRTGQRSVLGQCKTDRKRSGRRRDRSSKPFGQEGKCSGPERWCWHWVGSRFSAQGRPWPSGSSWQPPPSKASPLDRSIRCQQGHSRSRVTTKGVAALLVLGNAAALAEAACELP